MPQSWHNPLWHDQSQNNCCLDYLLLLLQSLLYGALACMNFDDDSQGLSFASMKVFTEESHDRVSLLLTLFRQNMGRPLSKHHRYEQFSVHYLLPPNMTLISDFFITAESSVPHYDGGDGMAAEDFCRFDDISPLQAGQLLALLRGEQYTSEHNHEFRLVSPEDSAHETVTMSVPQDLLMRLAKYEQFDIAGLAQRFAETTHAELGRTTRDFVPLVTALVTLSKRALASGKVMYLWNSL